MKCRVARFHNIYGPYGTWRGGREKAPAAFLRKAATSTESFEMWGNGLQTRSFCYIDDGVEGILRIMQSDYTQPLNLGTDEGVTMLEMAQSVTPGSLPYHRLFVSERSKLARPRRQLAASIPVCDVNACTLCLRGRAGTHWTPPAKHSRSIIFRAPKECVAGTPTTR